jgi:hypothetical protein
MSELLAHGYWIVATYVAALSKAWGCVWDHIAFSNKIDSFVTFS